MRRHSIGLLALLLLFSSCGAPDKKEKASYVKVAGETMGTTYNVTYAHPQARDFKASFDSLLLVINSQVNTYDPTSLISRFNQASDSLVVSVASLERRNIHFLRNYYRSLEVHNDTEQLFDPTVMPLVNYWGFGYTGKEPIEAVDSQKVDSLLAYVGMEKVKLEIAEHVVIYKAAPGVELDFSAIAKGYAVDVIGGWLKEKGVLDFLVEIGGEVLASGKSPRGKSWNVGINLPKEGASVNEYQRVVPLENRALATSGNYRQFYEVDGMKLSHTINPKSGFPERSRLLSASVFAPDCMTADAYATAFMVAGPDKALEIAERIPNLEVYLIVSQENGDLGVLHTTGLANLSE